MNKIIVYFFLLLLYLTLSKSLSPSDLNLNYINQQTKLESIIKESSASAILADIHSTGFIIKTYYLKLKVIYPLKAYEEIILRTSRAYKDQMEAFIGLSIFSRTDEGRVISYTPTPPGSVFVGDLNLGRWKQHNSGEKVWKFFRVYRHLPRVLGWGNFTPNYSFYSKLNIYLNQKKPFFGLNNEFGVEGKLTKSYFQNYFERQKEKSVDFKEFITNYFQNNFTQTGNKR